MPDESQDILVDSPASPSEYLPFLARETQQATAGPSEDCSFDLVVALAAKGFVILTGQSGTGKSRSAIELGQAHNALDEYENGEQGSSFELVPVGSDWVDSRPLLGYVNPFGKPRTREDGSTTHETYEIPTSLKLIVRAAAPANAAVPMFLVLDEMNLSHVERYFSTFLSLLEANRSSTPENEIHLLPLDRLNLISEILADELPNSAESKAADELIALGRGLPVPQNLLIIGTVNVDETTYMFSPKVLDRAHVLELHSVSPSLYFNREAEQRRTISARDSLELMRWAIELRGDGVFDHHPSELMDLAKTTLGVEEVAAEQIRRATETLLNGAYKLLDPVGFGFGFRVINEVFSYLVCWLKANSLTRKDSNAFWEGWEDALDTVFLQKVLPKIHGNRRQLGESLPALSAFLLGHDEASNPAARYRLGEVDTIGIAPEEKLVLGTPNQMSRSRQKLDRMRLQLRATGHTTFIQ